jgi:hypothetical protein
MMEERLGLCQDEQDEEKVQFKRSIQNKDDVSIIMS